MGSSHKSPSIALMDPAVSDDSGLSYALNVNGVHRWASVWVLAHAALACSVPESEHHRDVRVIDRVTADARPQPTGPGPVDSGAADGASKIDARDYYCNVPEPGPCCC